MAESSLKQLYEHITRGDEVRQNLISVRQMIRDESLRRKFMVLLGGDFSVLTGLLESAPLRKGLSVSLIVEDFRMYMDLERCQRQLDILLYGVWEGKNEE